MALVIPEVFADAVNSAMGVALRVGRVATDYTDMVDEITQYGDKVHFPIIDQISDAAVVTKGTAIVPDAVSMTDSYATVKQVAKSARLFDIESIQIKGATKDKLAEQLGYKMAKAIDADLVAEIKTAAYSDNVALASLAATDINGAFKVFGDNRDTDSFAGIIINSNLEDIIVGMQGFTSTELTYTTNGNGLIHDGMIGYWRGIPVIMSDNGTSYKVSVSGSDKDAYMLAIVKKDALGYVIQKSVNVEEEREGKLLATDLIASELYACKLIGTNGVSLLNVYEA